MSDGPVSCDTNSDPAASTTHSDLYDADYFGSYGARYYENFLSRDTDGSRIEAGSPAPYRWGETIWEGFFSNVAASIVDRLHPATVVDAGCGIGFLVKALRDFGIDADGFDNSTWAISQIPEALRPFCRLGTVTEELNRDVDLVTCIEVLEHVSPNDAAIAVANFCRHGRAVLFSSTPEHFEEVTHVNVHPPDYWAALFAEQGFYRECTFDASFISPHAVLFYPSGTLRSVVSAYERQRWDHQRELRAVRAQRDHLYAEVQRGRAASTELRALMATKTFRLRAKFRAAITKAGHGVSPGSAPDPVAAEHAYLEWIRQFDSPDTSALHQLERKVLELASPPTFSILMPVFNPTEQHLRDAIESVRAQTYSAWQLCIADDASTARHVLPMLREYAESDTRISITERSTRGNISEATNTALARASGEFVVLLDHDDTIPTHALACLAVELAEHPDAGLIYSDEDKIDEAGQRFDPYFKPGWNPELLLAQNYVSHLGAFRRSLVNAVGGFRSGLEGSQDYDLTFRVLELLDTHQIRHIPLVLYHWRSHEGSAASSTNVKPYAQQASLQAVAEHLQRTGVGGKVAEARGWGGRGIQWSVPDPAPRVRVLVGRTGSGDAAQTLAGLHLLTDYEKYRVEVVSAIWPFFTTDDGVSAQTDAEGHLSTGCGADDGIDAVCVLAAGVEPIDATWLQELVGVLSRPGVGVVGARLEDGEGALTGGPLVFGDDGRVASPLDGCSRFETRYFARPWVAHAVAALPPGALLVSRYVLALVGGLDANLDDYWRTVDLCLKVRARGLRVVWTPRARLGVKSSGMPRPAFSPVPEVLRERFASLLEQDPSYSPNLSLNAGEGFAPAWPPRREPPWAP